MCRCVCLHNRLCECFKMLLYMCKPTCEYYRERERDEKCSCLCKYFYECVLKSKSFYCLLVNVRLPYGTRKVTSQTLTNNCFLLARFHPQNIHPSSSFSCCAVFLPGRSRLSYPLYTLS